MSSATSFSNESIGPFLLKTDLHWKLDLFIKGVHCGHCVYKIENQINKKAKMAHYKFEAGGERLSLWSADPHFFPETVELINSLGFQAIPLSPELKVDNRESQFKSEIKRLAVAGVSAGNIMLFSVAIYLGADPAFTTFFHKLSLVLVLPSLFYSAQPIWKGFWQSLRYRRFNLDLPIGLALATGFLLSLVSFIQGRDDIYFDTIAVVTFLILASRFALGRYVSRIYQKNIVHFIPGVYQARRILNGKSQLIALQSISKGDTIEVWRGETLPVDAVLLSDEAILDTSVLTGESSPVVYKKGDLVFAGTQLCADKILLQSQKTAGQTRVGQLIERALQSLRHDQEESFYWVSRFTAFVLLSALVTFTYFLWLDSLAVGFYRAFAIVIVACPCAVSFGIPLIRSFSGQLAIKNGLVLKNPQVLKKIKKISHICFDKTGTLTQGRVEIEPAELMALPTQDRKKLLSLELSMDHPISKGFHKYVDSQSDLLPVQQFKYLPGKGLQGIIEGELWQVFSTASLDGQKKVAVFKEGVELTHLRLSTDLKKDILPLFKSLSDRGLKISLLSGDSGSQVAPIFNLIPRKDRGQCLSQASPEDKLQFVQKQGETAMMVGDGINDIAAMQSSPLSLCMPGALENNMSLADISMTRGDLTLVEKVFKLAHKVEQTERNLMIFTFLYNVTCVALAFTGYITPVVAAILMPVSSVTVLSLVTLSLRKL